MCRRRGIPGLPPVGSHRDLLAYLVRRLLENGANSSFVAAAADPNVPIEDILKRPQAWIGDAAHARHPHIPLPRDLYKPSRLNSSGVEFGDRVALNALVDEVKRGAPKQSPAVPPLDPGAAMAAAASGFPAWNATPVERRADILERAAELLEASRGRLIALLQTEGGKTLDDALSEVREAVDYCRYYAAEARRALVTGRCRDRPANRTTALSRARRVRLHQPVEFSAGDFLRASHGGAGGRQCGGGEARRADAAGRGEAVRLLHQAGVPDSALHLVPGDGTVGAALVADRASPALPSPARPRSGTPSTARSPPRTARSCR